MQEPQESASGYEALPVSGSPGWRISGGCDPHPFSGSLEAGVSRLLIEADVAASCLVIDQEIPPIDYDLMLYCAPEASPKAQRLWQEIDRDPTLAVEHPSCRTGDVSPV